MKTHGRDHQLPDVDVQGACGWSSGTLAFMLLGGLNPLPKVANEHHHKHLKATRHPADCCLVSLGGVSDRDGRDMRELDNCTSLGNGKGLVFLPGKPSMKEVA